jgi:hypothetical protein
VNGIGPFKVAAIGLVVSIAGCNTSRYGRGYDQNLPQIRHVAVVPIVEVTALHTGGVPEPRPDLVPQVRERALDIVEQIVRKQGRGADEAALPAADTPAGEDAAPRLALVQAVAQSVVTHHYQYGKDVILDYSAGDAGAALADEDADAVLYVYLNGIVPTGGRKALQAAIVVGVLTGVHAHVQTYVATVVLLLADRESGEVLWFNQYAAETSVVNEKTLRQFMERACNYLLKPRK